VKKLIAISILGLAAVAAFVAGCATAVSERPSQPRQSATWQRVPAAPITLQGQTSSAWTGKELIVSGLTGVARDGNVLDAVEAVEAYNPATRTWRRLPSPPKTENYCRVGAVWTGRELLRWGCEPLAFDPAADHWRRLPQAPTGQGIAVWTGKDMIGWGGGCCGDMSADGAAYDPATNRWRKLAPSPLAPEQGPIGAWTGHELILLVSGIDVGDGKPQPGRFARAAAYDPATDTWRRIAPMPEPDGALGGTAVWDGKELLVVGAGPQARDALAYDPAANRWRRLASIEPGRRGATVVWTGKRLLLWGGLRFDPSSSSPPVLASHGLAYDPNTDRWSPLPRWPLAARDGSAVAWTGRQLLVWGGAVSTRDDRRSTYLADGAAFTPELERSQR
jgi:hypothetical protein